MSVWVRYHLKYPGEKVAGASARFHAALCCTNEEAQVLEAILERNGATQLEWSTGSPPPWEVEPS